MQRHAARAGAVKGARESDGFACDFGQRGRRSYLPAYNDKLFPITNNAGQALLRVRRRVMDLRVILDNGGEGCPIAAYNDMLFR